MKNNAKMTKEEYLEAARELDYTDWRIQEYLQMAKELEIQTGKPFEDYGIFILELPYVFYARPINKEDFEYLLRDVGRYGRKSYYLSFKRMYEENFGIAYDLEDDVARHRNDEEELGRHICPVCGKFEFEEYNSLEICEVCHWQDDAVQVNDPDYAGGANTLSLNQARKAYKEGRPLRG